MSDGEIKKEDFFNAIKYGHLWQSEKIKEELEKIMDGNHHFRWDSDDKYHYIYDNECYLFIFDKNIEVRCDRDNVFSSHQNFEFEINTDNDIAEAYEKFKSITMEDEE
jgi:hypothetical protein